MNNAPTPETDAANSFLQRLFGDSNYGMVEVDFARKLERERDETRMLLAKAQQWIDSEPDWKDKYHANLKIVMDERDQLRKVADELAKHDECCHGPGRNLVCGRCNALVAYNSLQLRLNYGDIGNKIDLIKQIQLNAMKEGARRAAADVATHWNDKMTRCSQYEQTQRSSETILTTAEQWTKEDL